jgi:hypothetical protein
MVSVTTHPIRQFVIRCGDSELALQRWNSAAASAPGARHYCGEAHAELHISRWFDSAFAPSKPSFMYHLTGDSKFRNNSTMPSHLLTSCQCSQKRGLFPANDPN